MISGESELAGGGRESHRLESWKEIATHFGRGVTTVQRWERDEALPVHRQAHAKKGSVFAFRNELDDWRRSRTATTAPDGTKAANVEMDAADVARAGRGAEVDPSAQDRPRIPRRFQFATAATLGVMALLLAMIASPLGNDAPAEAPVTDWSTNGAALARVPLQKATSTFSQFIVGGPFSPSQAIDRYLNPSNGWAIAREAPDVFGRTRDEVAVFETIADVTASAVVFRLHFLHFNPRHLLGRFRLSVTSDHRDSFANELHTGGNVDAHWVVLQTPTVIGPPGMTFTTLNDHSVLVGGSIASEGIYTVTYRGIDSPITGVRLEALKHPSLPGGGGPGLYPASGNFFLTEFEMMELASTPANQRAQVPN